MVRDSYGCMLLSPDVVINRTKFYSQKCPGLKDKLYDHPRHEGLPNVTQLVNLKWKIQITQF